MSLRVAVQMDPLESINIAGDSSFALMLSAQARGHRLWHYDVRSLAWEDGRITAWARPVRVQRVEGQHYGFERDEAKIDLAADIDVVLMRQDPPFDLGYISAALLLDRLKGTTLVVNVAGARQCHAHAPILERVGLGEDAKVDRPVRLAEGKSLGSARKAEIVAFAVGQDDS